MNQNLHTHTPQLYRCESWIQFVGLVVDLASELKQDELSAAFRAGRGAPPLALESGQVTQSSSLRQGGGGPPTLSTLTTGGSTTNRGFGVTQTSLTNSSSAPTKTHAQDQGALTQTSFLSANSGPTVGTAGGTSKQQTQQTFYNGEDGEGYPDIDQPGFSEFMRSEDEAALADGFENPRCADLIELLDEVGSLLFWGYDYLVRATAFRILLP